MSGSTTYLSQLIIGSGQYRESILSAQRNVNIFTETTYQIPSFRK